MDEVTIPNRDQIEQLMKEVREVVSKSLDEMIADKAKYDDNLAPVFVHALYNPDPDGDDHFTTVVFDETSFGLPEDSIPHNELLKVFKTVSKKARLEPGSVFAAEDDDGNKVDMKDRFFGTLVHSGGRMLKKDLNTGESETHTIAMVNIETVDKAAAILVWTLDVDDEGVITGYAESECEITMLDVAMEGVAQNIMGFDKEELADNFIKDDDSRTVN